MSKVGEKNLFLARILLMGWLNILRDLGFFKMQNQKIKITVWRKCIQPIEILKYEATTQQKTIIRSTIDFVVYSNVFLCGIITLCNGHYAPVGFQRGPEPGRL
jgi:hypothetical protein